MCCHDPMGVHWKGEPSDCCHVHAEDAPSNQPNSGMYEYPNDEYALTSIPDGWTAQRALTGTGTVKEGVQGTFYVCNACGMELPSAKQHIDCPALEGARPMREHIPPKEFKPRQDPHPTEGPAEPA